MIIYNRDFTYPPKYDMDELVEVAKAVSTNRTLTHIKWINAGLNVISTLITLAIFGFNLIALSISFVIADILLLCINHFVFIVLPQRLAKTADIDIVKKRITRASNEIAKTKDRIRRFKSSNCHDYPCLGQMPHCYKCYKPLKQDIDKLQRFVQIETAWIENETVRLAKQVEQQKQVKAQEVNPKTKDHTNKKDHLLNATNNLKIYRDNYHVKFTDNVIKSLDALITTLDKKQIGYELVSGSMYAYLDELVNILGKWIDLDTDQKARYEKDIVKITKSLNENINNLIEKIDRIQTEGIEVGIAVLLKELVGQDGGEDDV